MENQIIKGDCFDVMQQFPDGIFDAIITDPPYMSTDLHFDKKGFDVDKWVEECIRVLKKNGYLISFGSIPLLGQISLSVPLRWSGYWLKSCPVIRTHNAKKPMSKGEPYSVFAHPNHSIPMLTFNKITIPGKPYRTVQRNRGYRRKSSDSIDRACTNGWTNDGYIKENLGVRFQTDVLEGHSKNRMKRSERTAHPTQKPISIMSTLIRMCTNENDLILDPFAGSGTLALACLETDRRYVCIEKDDNYFKIIEDRIERWHNDQLNNTGTHVIPTGIKRVKAQETGQLSLF